MIKIAIIGPESTAKSTITEALAKVFNSPFVAEYAREYVEKLDRPYTFEDVCLIAQKQIDDERSYMDKNDCDFVFFDTDLIITKVWFDYCYQQIPSFVQKQLDSKFVDLYLLCAADIEWKYDKVREHGHDREYFFQLYKSEIERLGTPYVIINGSGNSRIENAVRACQQFMKQVH